MVIFIQGAFNSSQGLLGKNSRTFQGYPTNFQFSRTFPFHRAPRSLFLSPSLPTTQRGLCARRTEFQGYDAFSKIFQGPYEPWLLGCSKYRIEIREFFLLEITDFCRNYQHKRTARCEAPWVRKSGYLRIRQILVVMSPSVRVTRELKMETFSGRRQLQPDVTPWYVQNCACSYSPHCRRAPVGDVKLVCLALWREREYLTLISIRFATFSNQNFADYRP